GSARSPFHAEPTQRHNQWSYYRRAGARNCAGDLKRTGNPDWTWSCRLVDSQQYVRFPRASVVSPPSYENAVSGPLAQRIPDGEHARVNRGPTKYPRTERWRTAGL